MTDHAARAVRALRYRDQTLVNCITNHLAEHGEVSHDALLNHLRPFGFHHKLVGNVLRELAAVGIVERVGDYNGISKVDRRRYRITYLGGLYLDGAEPVQVDISRISDDEPVHIDAYTTMTDPDPTPPHGTERP